jgi:hypothetical protein
LPNHQAGIVRQQRGMRRARRTFLEEEIGMLLLAYSFDRAREFIELVRGKLDLADWQELTLILSDRTAQRDFSLHLAAGEEGDGTLESPLSVISRQLHPLAPLGAPGTGLVGVGPALNSLHALGLGSDKDLAECLTLCGVSDERTEALTATLRNGGVLAFVTEEGERELLKDRGQELAFELPEHVHPVNAPVVAPAAPVSEQRATYNPLFTPTSDRTR